MAERPLAGRPLAGRPLAGRPLADRPLAVGLLALGLLGMGLLAPVTPARAQDDTLDQEARNLFEAGRTAYGGGRYEAALNYFRQSYELSQRGALLFNIGSALDRLQRNDEALQSYRAYLEALPDAPNRAFVERRIAFLESATSGGGGSAQQGRSDPAEVGSPEQAARTVQEPASSSGDGGGGPSASPGADSSAAADVTSEWWFWTIIGVVAAGAIAGVAAGVAVGTSGVEQPLPGDFPAVSALSEASP